MKLKIGRIVLYNTTESQRVKMANSTNCNTAKVLPAVIVAVFTEKLANLKVLLDGEGELWVTSAPEGTLEGQWQWPVIEPEVPAGNAKVS